MALRNEDGSFARTVDEIAAAKERQEEEEQDQEPEPEPDDNSDDGGDGGSDNDDSGHVIVRGDPSEGEDVESVGSGDTREEALEDAARNEDFDADSGTDVDRVEERLGTDQAEANPNDYSDGSTKVFEGETDSGNQVEVRKDRIEVGGKTKEITIIGESDPRVNQESSEALEQSLRNDGYNDFADDIDNVQNRSDNTKVVVGSNNQLEVQGFNRNTPDQEGRNRQKQRKNRGQNGNIDISNLEPVSDKDIRKMRDKLGIPANSGSMEPDMSLSQAEQIMLSAPMQDGTQYNSPYRPDNIAEEIAARDRYIQTAFERRPGYTTAQETERFLTDLGADSEAADNIGNSLGVTTSYTSEYYEIVSQPVQSIKEAYQGSIYLANNPVKVQNEATDVDIYPRRTTDRASFQESKQFADAGVTIASAGSRNPLRAVSMLRKLSPDVSGNIRKAAAKADPATGFGRTRLPGEPTPNTPEKVRAKAGNFLEFVKGDINPERRRRPDARGVEIDTNPRLPRKDRKSVENTYVKADELNPERDDLVVDQDGNVPVEIYERTRTDVAREKLDSFSQEINERMNTGTVGLGPGALLKKKDLETDDKLDSSSTDYITPDDRKTDTRTQYERNSRTTPDQRNRPRNNQRPDNRNRYEFDKRGRDYLEDVAGVSLGIAVSEDQEQTPFDLTGQDQTPTQTQDQPQENPPRQENPPEQDQPPIINTPDYPKNPRKPDRPEQEYFPPRDRDNPPRDRDFPDPDESRNTGAYTPQQTENKEELSLTGKYAPSVAGVLLNIKAEETPDTVTGFGIRGVQQSEDTENDSQDLIGF